MALPKGFVEQYSKKAEAGMLHGVKFSTMTREELTASLVYAIDLLAEERSKHHKDLDDALGTPKERIET